MTKSRNSGYWLIAMLLGLAVSAVGPAVGYLNLPDSFTTVIQAILVCGAFVMILFAIRNLQRS